MRMYVRTFLRHVLDAIFAAICVVSAVFCFYVFYTLFSVLFH